MPALFYNGIKGIVHKDGKLLVLRNRDHTGKHYWDIPGGRMDANESITEALHRELGEELPGITNIGDHQLLMAWRLPRQLPDGNGLILLFHLVDADVEDEPELSNEHSDFRWVSSDELNQLGDDETYIESGYKEALSKAFSLLQQ